MTRDSHLRAMMAELLQAIEVSLAASEAARALVEEILKRRAETGTFLQGTDASPSLTLTPGDREFLNALAIRFEDR